MINITITIASVVVQRLDAFIPTPVSIGIQWNRVKIMRPYLCPSVYWVSVFVIIHAARSCVHSMRMQTTCSNPLSGSIVFLSMCSSGCPRAFATFVFYPTV